MPRKTTRDTGFERLLRLIAAGEDEQVRRLLASDPLLATASAATGATRAEAQRHFLTAIGHYVYAGDTALHIGAAGYQERILRDLIDRGASLHAANRRGATPLHYAATGGPESKHWNPAAQAGTIELLVGAGADVEAADNSGVYPLHVAVRSRCAAAVRALLDHGASARRKNASGSTPLHLAVQTTGRGGSGSAAAKEQQAAIVQLLIDHGAKTGVKNARGQTVAQCARDPAVAGLLR